jgi:hypothetical protein
VPQERSYSEGTAEAVDRAVRELIDRAFDQASAILQSNRALLHRAAAAMLESETLNELEIERVKEEIVTTPALPAAAAIAASPRRRCPDLRPHLRGRAQRTCGAALSGARSPAPASPRESEPGQ